MLQGEPASQDSLAEILGEGGPSGRDAGLDWSEIESRHGEERFSELIYVLTRLKLEPEEARLHWEAICRHRQDMGRRLGRDPGIRVALADYFINIHPLLQDPLIVELRLVVEKERSAFTDELTGLYNRRFLNRELGKEIARARRYEMPFSLLMVDVDNFKRFNDTFGHTAGDEVLKNVARTLGATSRVMDHVVRFGGEEFLVILPGTDRLQALNAGERYREAVATSSVNIDETSPPERVTVSIGVATFPDDAYTPQSLIRRADEALYRAKRGGKNRVESSLEGKNRRQFARFPLGMDVDLRPSRQEPQHAVGRALDISLGGLLVEVEREIHIGEEIEVTLRDQANQAFNLGLKAKTVRLVPDAVKDGHYQVAVSFNSLSRTDEEQLTALIQGKVGASN